jgi:hypothetical protein
MGRHKGSTNRGYFYRAGRGWFSQSDGRMIALRDDKGEPLRSKATPVAELRAALRRVEAAPAPNGNGVTILEVCDAYLAKAKDDGADKTYQDRSDTLFDFCFGLPPRFRNSDEKPTPADSIHKGYADSLASALRPLDIDQWLSVHKTWKGGKRSRVQAVKRAMNYGVECGLLTDSPLMGYKVARQNARVTYLTPEHETALCESANPALAIAIKVCIRTGARPGCEFAALTAAHVTDHGERMEWVFQPDESKTKLLRILRITDADVIRIVREQIALHPTGQLFRNTRGGVWKRQNLALAFRKAKKRLAKKGIEFDKDACMYSCRHTYAKRILQGFWSGKQTNIETLARLMGNSPQVCRDHYLQWTETYNEPLWESA